MYKIYLNVTPRTKIEKYVPRLGKDVSEKLAKSLRLYQEGKFLESALLKQEIQKETDRYNKDTPELGIVKKDFSLMKMFYLVNTKDLSDSYTYMPYLLDNSPITEEYLEELVELEEFVKEANIVSKKVKLTNKQTNELWFDGDCLYQYDDVILTRIDDVIDIQIIDPELYYVEFGDNIKPDYNYETIYAQLCSNIKLDGLDIRGNHI